jgi:hypothetical protein
VRHLRGRVREQADRDHRQQRHAERQPCDYAEGALGVGQPAAIAEREL